MFIKIVLSVYIFIRLHKLLTLLLLTLLTLLTILISPTILTLLTILMSLLTYHCALYVGVKCTDPLFYPWAEIKRV